MIWRGTKITSSEREIRYVRVSRESTVIKIIIGRKCYLIILRGLRWFSGGCFIKNKILKQKLQFESYSPSPSPHRLCYNIGQYWYIVNGHVLASFLWITEFLLNRHKEHTRLVTKKRYTVLPSKTDNKFLSLISKNISYAMLIFISLNCYSEKTSFQL